MHTSTSRRGFVRQGSLAVMALAYAPVFATAGSNIQKTGMKGVKAAALDDLVAFIAGEVGKSVPGAALIASKNGAVFIEGCWGTYCSRTDRETPLEKNVVHPYFSFSKLVGSTVILTVVQEGRLDLDQPIVKYIPEFKGGGKDLATIRHLLTHSAGIPNVTIGSVETEDKWQAAVQAVCAAQAEWEPGSRCVYHGLTGQLMAAETVRRVLKNQTWSEICQERLFQPLAAKSLTYLSPPAGTPVALVPRPDKVPAEKGKLGEVTPGHPAGGCQGTIEDALKVVQLHLNRGKWKGKTILKPEMFQQMHTVQYAAPMAEARAQGKAPVHQSWGLGPLLRGPSPKGEAWFGLRDVQNPAVFGHAGIDTVIGTGDPEKQVALFFATTDSPNPKPKTEELRNEVTNRVLAAVG